ncbi:hypothetical protein [Eubacterium ramulus]
MRLKRRHFGFNVIKESFDQLPTATALTAQEASYYVIAACMN